MRHRCRANAVFAIAGTIQPEKVLSPAGQDTCLRASCQIRVLHLLVHVSYSASGAGRDFCDHHRHGYKAHGATPPDCPLPLHVAAGKLALVLETQDAVEAWHQISHIFHNELNSRREASFHEEPLATKNPTYEDLLILYGVKKSACGHFTDFAEYALANRRDRLMQAYIPWLLCDLYPSGSRPESNSKDFPDSKTNLLIISLEELDMTCGNSNQTVSIKLCYLTGRYFPQDGSPASISLAETSYIGSPYGTIFCAISIPALSSESSTRRPCPSGDGVSTPNSDPAY